MDQPTPRRRSPRFLAAALLLGLAPLVAVACGGGESGSAVPASPDLDVVGLDIRFDQPSYTAAAGDIEVAYRNQGQQVHSMIFEDADGNRVSDFRLQVSPGQAVGGSINLAPGAYSMICDIPGHEAAGMHSQLTVS